MSYEDKLHNPVMLHEMLQYLQPKDQETYLDCTFGMGGYTRKILSTAKCKVIGIDRDLDVSCFADKIKEEYGSRFEFWNINYSSVEEYMQKNNIPGIDGLILDLGVSSMQLDTAERGFSFMYDGPLDMRMSKEGETAKEFVNSAKEEEIANVIYTYGDEPFSRKIAKNIVDARKLAPITTTLELAQIVRSAIGKRNSKIDTATKTFQAIRIYLNQELEGLIKILNSSIKILKKGGRLIVVSFHSLEDSIVKKFLKENSAPKVAQSKYKEKVENDFYAFKLVNNKIITPSEEEIKRNPRARSARMRVAEKIN